MQSSTVESAFSNVYPPGTIGLIKISSVCWTGLTRLPAYISDRILLFRHHRRDYDHFSLPSHRAKIEDEPMASKDYLLTGLRLQGTVGCTHTFARLDSDAGS